MRKKNCLIVFCLMIFFAVPACGNEARTSRAAAGQSKGVSDVLEAGIAGRDALEPETLTEADSVMPTGTETPAEADSVMPTGTEAPEEADSADITDPEPKAEGAEGVDVDLTALSSTMVFSEVYNMMGEPESYVGKTVKMDGTFSVYYDEPTKEYYFACIIQDATACCAQGIEFELTDEYKYPDDYPEEGGNVCVVGVFDTYKENDSTYCTLRNARLV